MGIFGDITAPYSAIEAFAYDWHVAPAVADITEAAMSRELDTIGRGARLLDVGCGGGQIALAVARRRPDLEVTGVDLSADQVQRATRRAARAGLRVEFVEGTAMDLPFAAARFDILVSVASIKHWPDPRRGLEECLRVAKPGGQVMVTEADRGCRLPDAEAFVRRWRVPGFMRPVSLAFFRTWVAGRGLDADDARALVAGLGAAQATVERVPGIPALLIRLRKAA